MSIGKIAHDPKYSIGGNTSSIIKSSPATLFYSADYSFTPPSVLPFQGAIQRADIYQNSSVGGLYTTLDLNFNLTNTGAAANDGISIVSITKMWEYVKIFFDNVQILEHRDFNTVFTEYCRNLLLDSLDEGDALDKHRYQGSHTIDSHFLGGRDWRDQTEILPAVHPFLPSVQPVRVSIPLDLITSFLVHKMDTRLVNKITVEIKWKSVSGHDENEFMKFNTTGSAAIGYPSLTVANSFITAKSQLYTDPSLLWNLSLPYHKVLLKVEAQQFQLPAAMSAAGAATYTAANPMTVSINLAQAYSLHRRIIGLSFAISWPTGAATQSGGFGLQWFPTTTGARLFKGGKLISDDTNAGVFGRQSNHFLRCMGSNWIPLNSSSNVLSGATGAAAPAADEAFVITNSGFWGYAGGNALSFLDKNLAESAKTSNADITNVSLLGGLNNSQSENYLVEVDLHFPISIQATVPTLVDLGDKLYVYLHYAELLEIKAGANNTRSEN